MDLKNIYKNSHKVCIQKTKLKFCPLEKLQKKKQNVFLTDCNFLHVQTALYLLLKHLKSDKRKCFHTKKSQTNKKDIYAKLEISYLYNSKLESKKKKFLLKSKSFIESARKLYSYNPFFFEKLNIFFSLFYKFCKIKFTNQKKLLTHGKQSQHLKRVKDFRFEKTYKKTFTHLIHYNGLKKIEYLKFCALYKKAFNTLGNLQVFEKLKRSRKRSANYVVHNKIPYTKEPIFLNAYKSREYLNNKKLKFLKALNKEKKNRKKYALSHLLCTSFKKKPYPIPPLRYNMCPPKHVEINYKTLALIPIRRLDSDSLKTQIPFQFDMGSVLGFVSR